MSDDDYTTEQITMNVSNAKNAIVVLVRVSSSEKYEVGFSNSDNDSLRETISGEVSFDEATPTGNGPISEGVLMGDLIDHAVSSLEAYTSFDVVEEDDA